MTTLSGVYHKHLKEYGCDLIVVRGLVNKLKLGQTTFLLMM